MLAAAQQGVPALKGTVICYVQNNEEGPLLSTTEERKDTVTLNSYICEIVIKILPATLTYHKLALLIILTIL